MLKVAVHHKSYDKGTTAIEVLKQCAFEIPSGKVIALLGPSGCGKSTLLKIIMGLDRSYTGFVELDGKRVGGVNEQCSIMFQDHRLLPWLRVKENVMLAFERHRLPIKNRIRSWITRTPDIQEKRCLEMLDIVGLSDFVKRWPRELSGGMAQRVALARALVTVPRLLLLDEPFSSLPDVHRRELHQATLQAIAITGSTAIIVTHDSAEALALADIVIELSSPPTHVCRHRVISPDERRPYHSGTLDG